MASDKEEESPRYRGLELGIVAKNDDPEGLGRVRVIIPGLLDQPSPWAPQLGTNGGGAAQRGTFAVPPVGADVAVFFHRGDPQRPYYISGHFGKPASGEEVPTDVKAAKVADRPKIFSHETEHWILTFDDRPGVERGQIRHKRLDAFIELEGRKGGVAVQAETVLSLKSNGLIIIDAPSIQIGRKVVLKNGKPF